MKKHLKVLCLITLFFVLMGNLCTSAAIVYKPGSRVTFHNASPYYIVDDEWILGTHNAQMFEGILYVPIEDFKNAFNVNISYYYEDTSIFAIHAGKTLWQALWHNNMYVNGEPVSVPAPMISPIEPHPVMIPLEAYAKELGYTASFTHTDIYPPGQMLLEIDKIPYTTTSVEVNQAAQLVTVYGKGPNGQIEPIRHMLCSTGVGSSTPNGTFRISPLGTQWYYFSKFNCYVMYCSQLVGDVCFHSLTFNSRSVDSLSWSAYANIGYKASHGCIRLFVDDAKFIHQNCGGLPVTISPGYTNADTNAIRAKLFAKKPSYNDYVNSLR